MNQNHLKPSYFSLLATLALLALGAVVCPAASVTLAWDPNPETDIARYELAYGVASGGYTRTSDAGKSLEAEVTDLAANSILYFAVTAINDAGLRSPYSNEVIYYTGKGDDVPIGKWTVADPAAKAAFDGDAATFYRPPATVTGSRDLEIALGAVHQVAGFRYVPRQDGSQVGNIARYELYLSTDGVEWGAPAAAGTFPAGAEVGEVRFRARPAAFFRLRSLDQAECVIPEVELIEALAPSKPRMLRIQGTFDLTITPTNQP